VSDAWRIDVSIVTIVTAAEQIADDSRLFRFGTRTITQDGVDVITDQVNDESEPVKVAYLAELADVIANVDTARALLDGLLAERDDRIRRRLTKGVSYRVLGRMTGLSRAALDTIGTAPGLAESRV
jgi:hypothetical protein